MTKKLNIKPRLIDSIVFISNKNNDIKTFSLIFLLFCILYFFFTSWDTQPPFFVLSHVRSIVHIIVETCARSGVIPHAPLYLPGKYHNKLQNVLRSLIIFEMIKLGIHLIIQLPP